MSRIALLALVVASAAGASEIYSQEGKTRVFTNAPTGGSYESYGLQDEPRRPSGAPKKTSYVPRSNTPLHDAAMRDRLEEMEKLLAAGAQIEALGDHGRTPLVSAAANGRVRAVEFLLDHGAKPNARTDNGATALHEAAGNSRNLDVARLLLARGANPNLQNEHGLTPLHVASANNSLRLQQNRPMIELLVKNGASPNIMNEWNQRALPDEMNPFLHPPPTDDD